MASRTLAGHSQRYEQLSNRDIDHNLSNLSSDTDEDTTKASRPVVRRRRPRPHAEPRSSLFKAMSLAGLKNLFFHQTITPVPVRAKSRRDYGMPSGPPSNFPGPYDWSNSSNQPLLRPDDQPSQRLTSDSVDALQSTSIDFDGGDLESQSDDSKTEKANQKKGFRLDARIISDATIGLSDGLTVPFALTAGLSALGNTRVVIYGGFAELIAGAISMGLGGYLGAKSEAASYQAQKEETEQLIATDPQSVMADIAEVFEPYNLPKQTINDLTRHLADSPHLVDFVMQFQHCEEEPAASRALTSAITIALAYFLGGLLPLVPYLFVGPNDVFEGLYISIGVMVVTLFVFGYVKTCVVVGWDGGRNIREGCFGGVQMVIVGSAAAGAAMGLVRVFSGDEGGISM